MKALKFDEASKLMPAKIEEVFEQPKIFEQVKAIGKQYVISQIEFELVNLASLMSVGGNLNSAQITFIANQLSELYPNESIADLKICFQRGAIGVYGDIQRMDGITIGKWMTMYLDEKYELLEKKLAKEKNEQKERESQPVNIPDFDQLFKGSWYEEVKKDIEFDQQKYEQIKKERLERLRAAKLDDPEIGTWQDNRGTMDTKTENK